MAHRYACLPSTNICLPCVLQPALRLSLSLLSVMQRPCMELYDVQTTVTSQVSDFPGTHGTKIIPSGRFPSARDKPFGSLVIGVPVVVKAHGNVIEASMASSPTRNSHIPNQGCQSHRPVIHNDKCVWDANIQPEMKSDCDTSLLSST